MMNEATPTAAAAPTTSARRGAGNNGKWFVIKRENEMLAEYYRGVGVMPESDVEKYLSAMREPLPTSFRITPGTYLCSAIVSKLEALASHGPMKLSLPPGAPEAMAAAGETVDPPQPIGWYPHHLAWHFAAGRSQLRRCPELEDVHRFVNAQNVQGTITRQEEVSMVPPLLLDVHSHHRVLDMCAAPGSKTTELLELLHEGTSPTAPPTGFVVANELELDRSYLLAHQTKRMSSPCFLVTCNNAERYPAKIGPTNADFHFDRVLCDVPCSGDGTLRKNPDLWNRWHPRMGHRQHRVQIRIARRGALLLSRGGRLVYSTCSLNPVEDEAVVAELLRGSHGTLELVDVSKELPGLLRVNGISSWRVYHDKGQWATTWNDVPEYKRRKIATTCFPPTAEEAARFHLDRCIRILPHLQNTGGFFVAVLAKVADDPIIPRTMPVAAVKEEAEDATEANQRDEETAMTTTTTAAPTEDDEDDEEGGKKGKKKEKNPQKLNRRGFFIDIEPFYFVADMPHVKEALVSARDFYQIAESFPFTNLLSRNKDLSKILLVSRGVYDVVRIVTATASTASTADPAKQSQHQQQPIDEEEPLRLIHAGLKVFQAQKIRQIIKCNHRLSMESLRWVVPHMGNARIIPVPLDDFLVLLKTDDPLFTELPTAATREHIQRIDPGCFVINVDGWPGMSLCAWRGSASCHLLIPKEEIASLRNLFLPGMPPPPRGPQHRQKYSHIKAEHTAATATATATATAPAVTPPSPSLEPPSKQVKADVVDEGMQS